MLALLLALTGVVLGDRHDHDHDHDHEDHEDPHDHGHEDPHEHTEDFDQIDHRLDKLTSRIEHIKHDIHQRTDPQVVRMARSFKARVKKLEGT